MGKKDNKTINDSCQLSITDYMETIENEEKNEAIHTPKAQECEHSKEMAINPTIATARIYKNSTASWSSFLDGTCYLNIDNKKISIDISDSYIFEIFRSIYKYIADNPSVVANGLDLLTEKIATGYSEKEYYEISEFSHYRYNKDLKRFTKINPLPLLTMWYSIHLIQRDTSICIISEKEEQNSQKLYSLYSIKEGKIISPKFKKIIPKETETGTIFMFQDVVPSNITNKENNVLLPALQTEITGFILPNGVFYNGVYDDYFNKERMTELNSQPDFLQYNELKHSIAKDLDDEVEKIQKHKTNFETKVKSFYNRGK